MNRIKFLREGLKNLKTVGTLTKSSRYLCREIVSHIDFSTAKNILEIGAGDGVITKHILGKMSPDAQLLAFEVNEKFCKTLNAIDDERLHVIDDDARNLKKHLQKHGIDKLDAVVSAIPFIVIPTELGYEIVEKCRDNMLPGAPYIQVHYSLAKKKMYEKVFGNVDINFVFLNIPPAFALVSRKKDLTQNES